MSGSPIAPDHVKSEGLAKRMGAHLMAVVAEGDRGRVYLNPNALMKAVALTAKSGWRPPEALPHDPRNIWCVLYGLTTFADLFTDRQLTALTTFSDLVAEARKKIAQDATVAGLPPDGRGLAAGGTGARAYAEAVGVYLGFVVDKCADYWSTICSWNSPGEKVRNTFGRQAIPMIWDFCETNPLSKSSGGWLNQITWVSKALGAVPARPKGRSSGVDAATQMASLSKVVSTDPPYYDNIGYADLSDFFYVWLRRTLRATFPDFFATVAVPKADELVASPYRHGSRDAAERFFLKGMSQAIERLAAQAHPSVPVTLFYAFKQSERKSDAGVSSTGWETFLDAVIRSGFGISGTWPMRTELSNRMVGTGTNALASSIILVCRRRPENASLATRREFTTTLRATLAPAVTQMQSGNIAPVDLAQAAIGPGMRVYTRYEPVSRTQSTHRIYPSVPAACISACGSSIRPRWSGSRTRSKRGAWAARLWRPGSKDTGTAPARPAPPARHR